MKKYINILEYKKTELSSGLRCRTYLLENEKNKYIYQEYFGNTIYQAKKKYDILNMIFTHQPTKYIAKALSYKVNGEKSSLLTEFKEGTTVESLRKDNKFKLNSIAFELANTLKVIHSVPIKYKFGWITDNEVFENETFSLYLENELKRFSNAVKEKMSNDDYDYMMNIAKEKLKVIKKYDSKLVPQLIWYDLNPNNILVNNNHGSFTLSAIIDAGGAKIGIKEWDLAFLKMETCINQEEYNCLLEEYKKIDENLNEELIEALCPFIELDDMIIRILDGVKLPIPYDSSFEEIIKKM